MYEPKTNLNVSFLNEIRISIYDPNYRNDFIKLLDDYNFWMGNLGYILVFKTCSLFIDTREVINRPPHYIEDLIYPRDIRSIKCFLEASKFN